MTAHPFPDPTGTTPYTCYYDVHSATYVSLSGMVDQIGGSNIAPPYLMTIWPGSAHSASWTPMYSNPAVYPTTLPSVFSREGNARSDRQNRMLAGYLAAVGGYVNAAGVILIGAFTSHVTGNVGRLAQHASQREYGAALAAFLLVAAFFGGAFLVSVILESRTLGHVSRSYALALALEALLLVAFAALWHIPGVPVLLGAALLSVAMGLQNGLVTRLSGAVVRTTHLTGVVTDLGIEAARWFRFWRHSLSAVTEFPLVAGPNTPERPPKEKVLLLATITLSYFVGAVVGAFAAVGWSQKALLVPVTAVAACSLYAFVSGRRHEDLRRSVSP